MIKDTLQKFIEAKSKQHSFTPSKKEIIEIFMMAAFDLGDKTNEENCHQHFESLEELNELLSLLVGKNNYSNQEVLEMVSNTINIGQSDQPS